MRLPWRGGSAAGSAAPASASPPQASLDVHLIRDRFNFEWCMDNDLDEDTYWWWARSIRVDPSEVIADDGEGALWSIPFTTDGLDAVTFGDPVRVAETFVPVSAGEGAAATAVVQRRRQRALASFQDRPQKPDRDSTPAAAAAATPEEVPSMTDEQRRTLAAAHGLDPDAATEDQIMQAATAAAEARAAEQPEGDPPGSEEPVAPEGDPPPAQSVPQEAAASIRSTLGLPASASDEEVATAARELRDGAAAGTRVARDLQVAELDREASAAVDDGRIAPSAHDSWRTAIDPGEHPDAAATARAQREREALAALPTNRVPVRERGGTPPAARDNSSLQRALAASGLSNSRPKPEEGVVRRG